MMLREERPYESLSQRMTRDSWVIIFADLLALLLTFFVLIFSMTSIETKNWEALTESFARQLDRSGPAASRVTPPERAIVVPARPAIRLDYLSNVLRDAIRTRKLAPSLALDRRDDALVISLFAEEILQPGADGLSRRGERILFELTGLLSQLDNGVIVVGHVAPDEAAAGGAPAAIELSLQRAALIARAMRRLGYVRPLEVVGRGDSGLARIDPAAREERADPARRIDIMVMEKGRVE